MSSPSSSPLPQFWNSEHPYPVLEAELAAAQATRLVNSNVVNGFDVALLAILGIFIAATIPRAVRRFSVGSEWGAGIMLQAGSREHVRGKESSSLDRKGSVGSAQTGSSAATVRPRHHGHGAMKQKAGKAPPYVPSISTRTYPVSSFFSQSVLPNASLGLAFLLVLYLVGILMITFIGSNPLSSSDAARTGNIAVSQLPVVVVLGTKNNIFGVLLGIGYLKFNLFHQWVGVVVAVTAHLHAFAFFYVWSPKGEVGARLKIPFISWGLVALITLDFMWITSTKVVRQKAYNFFFASHILGFTLLGISLIMHDSVATKYVLLATVAYGIDHVLRILKSRICTARISAVHELGLTRIEIPQLTQGWRAGQHVRVRVLSAEMGRCGWFAVHPFTIASASQSETANGLVLMCKRAGGWTGRLFDAACKVAYYGPEEGYKYKKLKVIVEGPYGGFGHMIMASYSAAMIVSGGSGITFGLSVLEELVQKVASGTAGTTFIEFVWTVQDRASLASLLPTFKALVRKCRTAPGVTLSISLSYTRITPPAISPLLESKETPRDPYASLPRGISISGGRPRLSRVLDSIIERTIALQGAHGVAVAVCGPPGLVEETREIARDVDGPTRAAIGGIDVHEEMFTW